MPWPSPQDYNEAVQNPLVCFSDEELRNGTPEETALGLPKAATGAFASVYRFTSLNGRDIAVRCFLRDIKDQENRYTKITRFILSDDLPYTVPFEYLPEGIKIHDKWYPLLKMDWVHGVTLDSYLRANLQNPKAVERLADNFLTMVADLKAAGIAHGDLQHGNIMLTAEDELRLVDYDGMYVPDLQGEGSNELGHPNYQHPTRTAKHFNDSLDNFAVWVINASLRCLHTDPKLSDQLNCGDDALLFRRSDFLDPLHSPAFLVLEQHSSKEVRNYARWIRHYLMQELDAVPPVPTGSLAEAPALPAVQPPKALAGARNPSSISWTELRKYYETDRQRSAALTPNEISWLRRADYSPEEVAKMNNLGAGSLVALRLAKISGAWLLIIGSVAFCFASLISGMFAVLGLAGIFYGFLEASLIGSRFRVIEDSIKLDSPVEATLEFQMDDIHGLSFRVFRMYGFGALEKFSYEVAQTTYSIRLNRREFLARYKRIIGKRYRCFVWCEPFTGNPIAMVDNAHFTWLL